MTLRTHDNQTAGTPLWQVSGPSAPVVEHGAFTLGGASQFRDVALTLTTPLPALFDVKLEYQGTHSVVAVNTAGLPKENPPDGKFWQQPVGDTGYVARSAQEIIDAECRSDR